MTMTTLERLRQRRVELLTIAARRGALDMRIFGSVARGEDAGTSDVDFSSEWSVAAACSTLLPCATTWKPPSPAR